MPGPTRANYLTSEDAEALRRDHREVKLLLDNGGRGLYPPDGVSQSPEVYVAKIPDDGIPPRTDTTPGFADCDIYKIGDSGDLELADDVSRSVYNLSLVQIDPPVDEDDNPVDGYIPVWRDKYGSWLAGEISAAASTPATVKGVKWVNRSGQPIPPGGIIYAVGTEIVLGVERITAWQPNTVMDKFWLVNASGNVVFDGVTNDFGHWGFDPSVPGSAQGGGIYAAYSTAEGYPIIPGDEWGPKPGSFLLHPSRPGFQILGTEVTSIAGQPLIQVIQRMIVDIYGYLRTDSPGQPDAMIQGGTCKLEIWIRGTDAKRKRAGWDNKTVYDNWLNKNDIIKANTRAKAHFQGGWWELDNSYCEVDDTGEDQAAPGVLSGGFSGGIGSPSGLGDFSFMFGGAGTGQGTGF